MPGVSRRRTFGDTGLGVQHVETIEFVEAIDNDATDAGSIARRSSAIDLLLPCSTSRSAGTPAWSAHGVRRRWRRRGACLRRGRGGPSPRIGTPSWRRRLVAECLDRLAAAITEMLLVVDENRGSELLCKLKGVAPSDVEHAVMTSAESGNRRVGSGRKLHRLRGGDTEQPQGDRRPTWLAATSARRAGVSWERWRHS